MRYPIAIEPGTDTTAWGVVVPDLPGCFSAGDTLDEAIEEAREAIILHLDGLLDDLSRHLQPNNPLLVVLDDYHLAQGPVLDRCLQFFLNHLPPGLVLLVTSRQRPDWHLARLRLSAEEDGPIPFELSVPSARIDQKRTYALSARISYGGKTLYVNTTQHRVLTQGAPLKVDLRVERVAA